MQELANSSVSERRNNFQRTFDGTIASACSSDISLKDFIGLLRFAKDDNPTVGKFLKAWDALEA